MNYGSYLTHVTPNTSPWPRSAPTPRTCATRSPASSSPRARPPKAAARAPPSRPLLPEGGRPLSRLLRSKPLGALSESMLVRTKQNTQDESRTHYPNHEHILSCIHRAYAHVSSARETPVNPASSESLCLPKTSPRVPRKPRGTNPCLNAPPAPRAKRRGTHPSPLQWIACSRIMCQI